MVSRSRRIGISRRASVSARSRIGDGRQRRAGVLLPDIPATCLRNLLYSTSFDTLRLRPTLSSQRGHLPLSPSKRHYMNLSFPVLSPIPPPDKYHHDYSDLRSPILTQSVPSPIYTIVQSPEFFSDFSRTILPFFQLIPWIMAAILGGGEEAMGQLGQFPLEQWFFEMPPCTRYWTTATVITSILLQCKVITPFQLFYSWRAVYYKSQVRTILSFCLAQTLTIPVLATDNHVHILRPTVPRPCFPRLLPPEILTTPGTRFRPFTSGVFMASPVCVHIAACSELAYNIDTLPWLGIVKHSGLHLV